MIRSLLTLALIAVPFSFAQADGPQKVSAQYKKVYAPFGFDSNDVVQVVAEGTFENTCYRPAETTVRVDDANKKIYLSPAAYKYPGLCLQVILPFERTIDLGIIPAGNWEVLQESSNEVLGQLKVKGASRAEADDYLYAPVSQAMFHQNGQQGEIILSGNFLSGCMEMDQVKVDVQEDVIVVQPIAKVIERNDCPRGGFPFSKVIKVNGLKAGRYLLHVRSMNAKAVNDVVDFR